MALQSCYECNKEISTKAVMCPHCGAPQNSVSGKAKDGFFGRLGKTFKNVKNNIEMERLIKEHIKEIERKIEEDMEEVIELEQKGKKGRKKSDYEDQIRPNGTIQYAKRSTFFGPMGTKDGEYALGIRRKNSITPDNDTGKFPTLYRYLNGHVLELNTRQITDGDYIYESTTVESIDEEIVVLMEKMEIESGWEKEIWRKINEIRSKREKEKPDYSKPTILSRFRQIQEIDDDIPF